MSFALDGGVGGLPPVMRAQHVPLAGSVFADGWLDGKYSMPNFSLPSLQVSGGVELNGGLDVALGGRNAAGDSGLGVVLEKVADGSVLAGGLTTKPCSVVVPGRMLSVGIGESIGGLWNIVILRSWE